MWLIENNIISIAIFILLLLIVKNYSCIHCLRPFLNNVFIVLNMYYKYII